jgi:CRP-like cAMP-binding protein
MGAAEELVEEIELNNLVPLNSLNPKSLDKLISLSTIKRLPPGRHLFNQGDTDNTTIYLLSGQLALVADGEPAITIKAGTSDALNPISNQQPRPATALARTSVTTLAIDTDLLNKYFSHDDDPADNSNINVSKELHLQRAFETPLLAQLPMAHKQVLMQRFEQISVRKGNVIIQKGSKCDYYYLIAEGRCLISQASKQSFSETKGIVLAAGQSVGEEALIAHAPYKYTVTMLEDGTLLALSRGEFMTLLVRPVIIQLPYPKVINRDLNTTTLLDIRTPKAFYRSHLKDSINLPLTVLKDAIPILNKSREYVICSDNHQRNIIAAFLLLKHGLDAKILNQGIRKTLVGSSE